MGRGRRQGPVEAGQDRGPAPRGPAAATGRLAGEGQRLSASSDHGRQEGAEKGEERERREERPAGQEVIVLYTNAQSLIRKTDELTCLTNELKPDLILVTETWAHQDINSAHLNVDGYEIQTDLRRDRVDTSQGGEGEFWYMQNQVSQ